MILLLESKTNYGRYQMSSLVKANLKIHYCYVCRNLLAVVLNTRYIFEKSPAFRDTKNTKRSHVTVGTVLSRAKAEQSQKAKFLFRKLQDYVTRIAERISKF